MQSEGSKDELSMIIDYSFSSRLHYKSIDNNNSNHNNTSLYDNESEMEHASKLNNLTNTNTNIYTEGEEAGEGEAKGKGQGQGQGEEKEKENSEQSKMEMHSFDIALNTQPSIKFISEILKVKPLTLVSFGFIMAFAFLSYLIGPHHLLSIITLLKLTYLSYKCLSEKSNNNLFFIRHWIIYWLVYSLFSVFNSLCTSMFSWVNGIILFRSILLVVIFLIPSSSPVVIYHSIIKKLFRANRESFARMALYWIFIIKNLLAEVKLFIFDQIHKAFNTTTAHFISNLFINSQDSNNSSLPSIPSNHTFVIPPAPQPKSKLNSKNLSLSLSFSGPSGKDPMYRERERDRDRDRDRLPSSISPRPRVSSITEESL